MFRGSPSLRTLRAATLHGLLAAALWACGGQARTRLSLSQPSFASCVTTDDCAVGSCLCGICSAACSSDAECGGGFDGRCATPGSDEQAFHCAGRSPEQSLCVPTCTSDDDCPLGACSGGACVGAVAEGTADDEPQANAEAPPSGSLCNDSPVLWRSLVIENQAQLDALNGCREIRGGLEVALSEGMSTEPLAALERVSGQLYVHGPESSGPLALAEHPLAGLRSLQSAGWLAIGQLALPDLQPLSSLSEIENTLSIGNCSELQDLEGLSALRRVPILLLSENPDLQSLRGASSLASVDQLFLDGNGALRDVALPGTQVTQWSIQASALTDLSSIRHIGTTLRLQGMPQLTSLAGLPPGTELTSLSLGDVDQLRTLEGLEAVSRLEALSISRAPSLTGVVGLPETARVSSLTLQDTPQVASLAGMRWAEEVAQIHLYELPWTRIDLALGDSTLQWLLISNLGQLESLAGLEELTSLEALSVSNGDRLQSLDGLGSWQTLSGLRLLDNPLLFELPSELTATAQFGYLQIFGTELTQLSFPNLTQLQTLQLQRNKRLVEVRFEALTEIDNPVQVSDNPALSPASLEALAALGSEQSVVESFAGAASPCPWRNDGECDVDTGLCAARTDREDCEESNP